MKQLSLDNLKIDQNHEHLQFNVDHADLRLDPNILNSIEGVLDTYEKKKILDLDELDEELKGIINMSLQRDMDQKVAEIARRGKSRQREESITVRRTGVFRGIQGYSGYTGCYGVTGTQGSTGFYGITGMQGSTGCYGVTGTQGFYGVTGYRREYIEETPDGFTVRCRVGKPQPRSGYISNE